MTLPMSLLEAQKMQNIAMRKVSEHKEVKAIMERIEKAASEGRFSVWVYRGDHFNEINRDTLTSYLSLQGFHIKGDGDDVLIQWCWKVTPLMPIEEVLYEIADNIFEHE